MLAGRFSNGVMDLVCRQRTGLFPSPSEIELSCSCPDWAAMCKHVAAVLYAIGARLDEKPDLLFTLRRVRAQDMIAKAGDGLTLSRRGPAAGRVLRDEGLSELFGIEMAEAPRRQRAPMATVSAPAFRCSNTTGAAAEVSNSASASLTAQWRRTVVSEGYSSAKGFSDRCLRCRSRRTAASWRASTSS
jgi:uncharacterized Zn finger protein